MRFKYTQLYWKIITIIVSFGTGQVALAADHGTMNIPDPVRMMWVFSHNYRAIRMCICGFAFVAGLMLIVKSIHKLREYGQIRTMMPSHAEFLSPMTTLFIGIFLIFLPTTINITIASFWGYGNPLTWAASTSNAGAFGRDIGGLVQILGLIALVRGLIIMSRAAQKGAQPGQFGKGMTHTVGGILAINYWGVVSTIKASFGLL